MTVDNSETHDNVDTAATENTGAESQEIKEWGEGEEGAETQVKEETQEPEKEPEKPKRSRAQERIEQTTRENAELKRKLAEYETKAKTSEIKRPVIDDFEDFGKYEEALEQYHIDKAEERVLAKLDERESSKSQEAKQAEFQTALMEIAEEYADFDSVLEAGLSRELPMPISIDELASEFGYDAKTQTRLLYELAKDAQFHEEVSSSSKLKAARLLSEKVDSFSQAKTPPPVSKAPKPINPVKANAPAARSTESMSDNEFLKSRGL